MFAAKADFTHLYRRRRMMIDLDCV